MKPLGAIPSGYGVIDGQLAIAGRKANDLVAEAGSTPLFVYSRQHLERRIAELRAAMPERLALHYAVKANPTGRRFRHRIGRGTGNRPIRRDRSGADQFRRAGQAGGRAGSGDCRRGHDQP
jgi:diaminopimelate decarboxylase